VNGKKSGKHREKEPQDVGHLTGDQKKGKTGRGGKRRDFRLRKGATSSNRVGGLEES